METISFKEVSLQEFAKEVTTTRVILERVPFAEKKDWKPHEKSMALGALAKHVAMLPSMVANIIEKDSLSFGVDGNGNNTASIETVEALVEAFDGHVRIAKAVLEGTDDAHLAGEWELTFNDGARVRQVFKGSRALAYRTLFMDHLVHHRAQLGVYLRLNDIALPGSYGPSADEGM